MFNKDLYILEDTIKTVTNITIPDINRRLSYLEKKVHNLEIKRTADVYNNSNLIMPNQKLTKEEINYLNKIILEKGITENDIVVILSLLELK